MARNAAVSADAERPESAGQTADDVDRIRDIIFGGQMREYQQRFEQLERSVADSIARLSAQVEARFDNLRTELATEAAQRAADAAAGKNNLAALDQRTQQALATRDSAYGTKFDELAGLLASQQQNVLKTIDDTRTQLANALSEDTARLTLQKVDAQDLAKLLSEVAVKLSSAR